MLTFKEMIYVFAVMTLCFIACVMKTAYILKSAYVGFVSMYILSTFALFVAAFLIFVLLKSKCAEYRDDRKRDTFLAAKKIRNISEIVYLSVFIFYVACFFDIFNGAFVGNIYRNFLYLFSSYPFWEIVIGAAVLAFGFHAYWVFYDINKLFSASEYENMQKTPQSVYDVINRYPTFEEYERGVKDKTADSSPKRADASEYTEQDIFLKENEVPIADIDRRLAGLDVDEAQGKNGGSVYRSSFDYVSTPSGDNELVACPFCGSLNTEGSDECSFCGAEIKSNSD